ncbi:MAG TPA: hypothetical protein VII20_09605 [Roseiarcus sp.]
MREPFGQRWTVDKLHREIGALQIWIDRKDEIADDSLMLKIVQSRRFAAEQREHVFITRQFRQDHFDRDEVAGLDVESFVDFSHAALRKQRLDFVHAVEADAAP